MANPRSWAHARSPPQNPNLHLPFFSVTVAHFGLFLPPPAPSLLCLSAGGLYAFTGCIPSPVSISRSLRLRAVSCGFLHCKAGSFLSGFDHALSSSDSSVRELSLGVHLGLGTGGLSKSVADVQGEFPRIGFHVSVVG